MSRRKKISIVIPTYNEEKNIFLLLKKLTNYMEITLKEYEYEILLIDNYSTDNTRTIVKEFAGQDKRIKAIFNARNFGGIKSPYYGLLQSSGDCAILMCADFQDPIELIGEFVNGWEEGYKIVIGRKTKSRENRLMYLIRSVYYKLMEKISTSEQIAQFTGFGLYDSSFIKILNDLNDPAPYLRGLVSTLGFQRKEIEYVQPKRLYGETSTNFFRLYDVAMLGITSSSKVMLRFATLIGFALSGISLLIMIIYFVYKLLYWDSFQVGVAPLLMGLFFFCSIILFFLGILGEYVLSINERVMHRPVVIEEERINFEETK